jgi:hypothetical protein
MAFLIRKTGVERRLFWSIPVPDNKKLVEKWYYLSREKPVWDFTGTLKDKLAVVFAETGFIPTSCL